MASGGVVASAVVSTSLASIERLLTRLYSFSSMLVRGSVMSVRSAAVAALEPNRGFFRPDSGTEPLVETWYCTAALPDR